MVIYIFDRCVSQLIKFSSHNHFISIFHVFSINEKLRRLDVETDVPEKEEEKKPARGGIAVVNVNRRIRLLFGEEYGIHVYSKEGIGTDVIVELPLVRDGDRQGGWR